MGQINAIENQVAAGTETGSSAYVPPCQLTAGQPPPIAAERRVILHVVRPGRGCRNRCGDGGGAQPDFRGGRGRR